MTRADRVERILRALERGKRTALSRSCVDADAVSRVQEEHDRRVRVLMHVLAITEDADVERIEKELGL